MKTVRFVQSSQVKRSGKSSIWTSYFVYPLCKCYNVMKKFEDFIYLNMDKYPHFLSFLYLLFVSVKIKNAIFILEVNYIILLDLNINMF